MSNIASLANIASMSSCWGATCLPPQSFSFNGTNGYIQQVGFSSGVVWKRNDGTRDYWQCYWGFFNLLDQHWLDNRSIQTQKHVFMVDDLLNNVNLSAFNAWLSFTILTTWKIQFEVQWTWSARITTNETISPWVVNCVEVRVNNTLPSWTPRSIDDADIFINWVKATKTVVITWNSTWTTPLLYWWAYNTTINPFRWRLYSFSIWNRALSDAECQAEGLSNWAVVTSSWLVNTRDTTNTSQAIARTWYNLNVSGNVSVATDWDGKYIYCNGNKTLSAGTSASATATSSPTLNQTTAFTIKARFKFGWVIPSSLACWIFWRQNIMSIYAANVSWINQIAFRIRNGATLTDVAYNSAVWTLYDWYLVFDPVAYKMYAYISVSWGTSTLINPWWTTVAASTFWWSQNFIIGDDAVWWGNTWSTPLNIYHARIRARALTQSDINADIALWNNTNNDPTIVASYRPDNLANQQFMLFPNDLTNAVWARQAGTTVTANYSTAPDWTTTANRVQWWTWWNPFIQWLRQYSNILSWVSLASKTFVVKAFVRSNTWANQTFRLSMWHTNVSSYYSWDLTATTTRQQFTYVKAFWTSTTGTAIDWWIVTDLAWTACDLQVRWVKVFLIDEILYDNSPNIGGYVWPFSNRYISLWFRPWVDALNDSSGNPIMNLWYWYVYIRDNTNAIRIRYDDAIWAKESSRALWNGFRGWAHFTGWIERDWTNFRIVTAVNWDRIAANQFLNASHLINPALPIISWRISSRYYTWGMRDKRMYTSPTALTDADLRSIANWWEPASATKVLHRWTKPSDTWNLVLDLSWNGRVWRMTGWVTRGY